MQDCWEGTCLIFFRLIPYLLSNLQITATETSMPKLRLISWHISLRYMLGLFNTSPIVNNSFVLLSLLRQLPLLVEDDFTSPCAIKCETVQ